MKNVAFVVVALGMVACNSPRPNVVDSGGIVLTDSGGSGRDTGGSTTPDTGGGGATCGTISGTSSWPALPASCLPRCTTATANAYNACITTYQASGMTMADQTTLDNCTTAALMADHTATVMVGDGTGTVPISCGGDATTTFACLDWQLNAAIAQSCDAQFGAYLQCAAGLPAGTSGMSGCPTEYSAVQSCITANMAAIQTANNTLGSMCFGG